MIPMLIPAVRQILFGQSLEKKVQAIVRRNGIAMYVPIPGVTCFQDSACTTAANVDDPVGGLKDYLGLYPATQSTSGYRPILRGKVKNWLLNSATLSTQSVSLAVSGITWTLAFEGTGTVILSGGYVGSLVGTGVSDRVSLTFTTTAATNVTYTVSGSVTNAQIELGSVANPYVPTTSTPASSSYGPYWLEFGLSPAVSLNSPSPSGWAGSDVTLGVAYRANKANATTPNWGGLISLLSQNNGGVPQIALIESTLRVGLHNTWKAWPPEYSIDPGSRGNLPNVVTLTRTNSGATGNGGTIEVREAIAGLFSTGTQSFDSSTGSAGITIGALSPNNTSYYFIGALFGCYAVNKALSSRDRTVIDKYFAKLAGYSI